MNIRLLSASAALVLGLIGAILIVFYVQGADQRALAGTVTRPVLVVEKPISAGTPVAEMGGSVTVKNMPVAALASGAMATLQSAPNTVAAIDLVPGEQVLRSRLIDPSSLQSPGTVAVPTGLQEVTVLLGPDRTVGARIRAGQSVGVFVSFPGAGTVAAMTQLLLQKVLVTSIQGAPAQPTSGGSTATAAPTGSDLVTLALSAADAEKIIFSAENGSLWMSSQPAGATESTTRGVTREGIFR